MALYVNYAVRPSQPFLLYHAVILVLTYTLVSRIVLAIVQGYYRAVGAVPRSWLASSSD